ncbi:recombinase family protein [Streptomyces sp. uw30]|uniref:recombinase family protein n=1 Tax=Streptomyces sp. uw30 TaxID=1828179 RepID=UPI00165156D5|nr:recombinase family protein [Streptomyces sp. uw30]
MNGRIGGLVNHHAAREPSGLIPVASYARTSEDVRQRDGHGVRYQLRINERTAHEHGCVVVAAYSDNGRSASKTGVARPGFDQLVADLARGHTDSGQRIEGVVEAQGLAKLPPLVRDRWRSGEMELEEKRKVVASVVTRCIVRPGVKGAASWDHSRVEPLPEHPGRAGWRYAEPTGP